MSNTQNKTWISKLTSQFSKQAKLIPAVESVNEIDKLDISKNNGIGRRLSAQLQDPELDLIEEDPSAFIHYVLGVNQKNFYKKIYCL